MKRSLCWLGGIALVFGGLLTVAAGSLDAGFISRKISDIVTKNTGSPLKFQTAPEITLLPPGITFSGISWNGIKNKEGTRFSARGGELHVKLAPLIKGEVVISELLLESPSVEILQKPSVRKNAPVSSSPSEIRGKTLSPPAALPLEVDVLHVSGGSLLYTYGNARYALTNVDLGVTDLRNGHAAKIECSLSYDMRMKKEKLSGNLALAALVDLFSARPSVRELDLTLTPSDTAPRYAAFLPLHISGNTVFHPQTHDLRLENLILSLPGFSAVFDGSLSPGTKKASGSLSLTGSTRALASAFGVELRPSENDGFSLEGNVRYENGSVALSPLTGKLDTTSLQGDAAFSTTSPVSVTASLRLGEADINSYLPLPSPDAGRNICASIQERTSPAEKTTDETGKTNWPTMNIHISMDSLTWNTLCMRDILFELSGDKGFYTLKTLRGALGSGGGVVASGSGDVTRSDYRLKFNAQKVNIAPVMEAQGKKKGSVQGKADVKADLSASGKSIPDLLRNLSGSGRLEAKRVRISALTALLNDMPELRGVVPDSFEQMEALFIAHRGELNFSPVTAISRKMNLQGQALASLPGQSVHGTATITALGLNIPIIFDGPFNSISYALDPRFAVDMVKGVGKLILKGGESVSSHAGDVARDTGTVVKDAAGALRGLLKR